MTKEMARKIQTIFSVGIDYKSYKRETGSLADSLEEALEKQIPKKPIYIPKRIFENEKYAAYCPVCKDIQVTHCDYCYRCGQKLDREIK